MSIEQIDVVDAFVEIAREDSSFPLPLMKLVLVAFAKKLGLEPVALARLIGERDRELHDEPLPYTGDAAEGLE